MPIRVVYSESFIRAAKKLKKAYRHVDEDVEALADQLEAGETPGDRIPGLTVKVYKARLRNTDARRSKSGGYRVIYYLETADSRVFITIYSKSDQSDIPLVVLRQLIREYENSKSDE